MSAQETSATAHLFPVGLLPEELAHHLESFPTNRTLSNEQLTEYQGAKFKVLAWLDTVARTYQNQWQQDKVRFPELGSVTSENYEEKKAQLAGKVSTWVWEHYEKAREFSARKSRLQALPTPLLSSLAKGKGHGSHDSHAFIGYQVYGVISERNKKTNMQVALQNATVWLEDVTKKRQKITVLTNETGYYQTPQVDNGTYKLTVITNHHSRFYRHSQIVEIKHFPQKRDVTFSYSEDEQSAENEAPKYQEEDNRYRQIVHEEIAKLKEVNPAVAVPAATFLLQADGTPYINPDILRAMPTLHDTVQSRFETEHKERADVFREAQAKRVYTDQKGEVAPTNDPRYIKVQSQIQSQTNADFTSQVQALQQKSRTSRPMWAPNKGRIEAQKRGPLLDAFYEEHPELAELYAEKDPHLAELIRVKKEQGIQEHAKSSVAKTIEASATAAATSAALSATAATTTIPTLITEESSPEEYAKVAPSSFSPISISQGTPGGSPPSYMPSATMPPSGSGGGNYGGGGLPPNRRRGGVLPGGIQNIQSLGSGVQRIGMLASKVGVLFQPWVGIPLAIIFVIFIILFVTSYEDTKAAEENIPVTITKEGPESVENGGEITYTINVSYPGTATDVIVTDPIPEGTELVVDPEKTTGVYTCEPSPCGPTTKTVTWKFSQQEASPSGTPGATSPTTSPTQTASGFDQTKFEGYGFPPPQTDKKWTNGSGLEGETLSRWQTYSTYAVKAAQLTGTDVGIIGMWAWLETGVQNYAENCSDDEVWNPNPNEPCYEWNNWQIGNGIQIYQRIDQLEEALDAMHPGKSVTQVGQSVIDGSKSAPTALRITAISTFPTVTTSQLVSGAKSGDTQMQYLAGILFKDPGISAYMVGVQFRDSEGLNAGLANKMDAYDGTTSGSDGLTIYTDPAGSDYYDKQDIINRIKTVYDTGVSGGGGGASFPSYTFKLTIKPLATTTDTYIINQASAQVIGGSGGGGGSTGGGTGNGCIGSPDNIKWAAANEWDDIFLSAGEEFGVPPHVLKAVAWTESRGAHYNEDGSVVVRGCDGFDCEPAVGMMQIKAGFWGPSLMPEKTIDYFYTPEGNVRLAAKFLVEAYKRQGSWAGAMFKEYFPADDNNGTSQSEYEVQWRANIAELDEAGGCTTPPLSLLNNYMKQYVLLSPERKTRPLSSGRQVAFSPLAFS